MYISEHISFFPYEGLLFVFIICPFGKQPPSYKANVQENLLFLLNARLALLWPISSQIFLNFPIYFFPLGFSFPYFYNLILTLISLLTVCLAPSILFCLFPCSFFLLIFILSAFQPHLSSLLPCSLLVIHLIIDHQVFQTGKITQLHRVK